MRYILAILFTAFGVVVVGPASAFAQASNGQISGRITDAQGAVLPGVTVTATQTETRFVRSTVTNEAGIYTLPNLPIGPYRLEASLQGFQTFVQTGTTLQVNANLVVDAAMRIGNIAEAVTSASCPMRSSSTTVPIPMRRVSTTMSEGRASTDGLHHPLSFAPTRRSSRSLSR